MKKHKSGVAHVALLGVLVLAGAGYFIYNSVNSQIVLDDQPAQANSALGSTEFVAGPTDNKITITAPSAGQSLQIGKKYTVRWTGSEKGVSRYNVYLIAGGGDKVKTVAKLGTSGYFAKSLSFVVPMLPLASDYRIQLGGTSVARSEMFSIVDPAKPKITVISPNGGETVQLGKTYHVKWSSVGMKASEKVNISLQSERSDASHNLMETPIATNVTNSGNYAWKVNDVIWNKKTLKWEKNYKASVPAKDVVSGSFKIIIRPAKGVFGEDYSDATFTISRTTTTPASNTR